MQNNSVSVLELSSDGKKECGVDLETVKRILDNTHDELFILDSDDRVLYVNRVSERHYGMKASEVVGRSIYELNSHGYWYPTINALVRREKRRVTLEQMTFLGRKLLSTVTPVLDDKGEVEFIIYESRDITQLEAMKHELEITRRALENSNIKNHDRGSSCDIICHSKKMKELIEFAEQVAGVDSNILILGESGTGKGLFARHIHKNSPRREERFVSINCAAIPEGLLESELFGYAHGAFTGANKGGKKGLIELAEGGTLFFDEIAELTPRLQAKILQFIQDQQYIPVGGTKIKKADVRILSATNRNLHKMIKMGKFRSDLYYRLNVVELTIPPLRERPEDIRALVSYFIGKYNKKYNICREVSEECMDILYQYSWPGNVRELENLIERLVVTVSEYMIKPNHLPPLIKEIIDEDLCNNVIGFETSFPAHFCFDSFIEKVEERLIANAVEKFGSTRKVAKALNISHSKAARLMKKYC